ncbi:MAG TPA: SprB repeat-containing protein, partial [Bacteroidia bacterium]|nr:SprB repeat-containing protein [Bacteroidia bacterium]
NCNATSGNLRFDNFSLFGDSNTLGVTAVINRRNNVGPCYGDSNGSARVYVQGGTAPYTFSWSNNATNSKAAGGLVTDSAFGLKAGTYTVNVTDAGSNTTFAYVTILGPTQVVPSVSSKTNISCNGGNNGAINTTTTGGTAPYTYSWSNGKTTANITGLTIGSYTLTVMDKFGCSGNLTVNLTQPTAVTVTTSTIPVTCAGPGSATAIPTGGTPYIASASYKFSWSSGPTSAMATGLGAGTYTVIATDSLGCTGSATATVITTGAVVTLTPTDLTCNGSSNGSVISSVTGGSTPYTYNWSNGATTTSINGLSAGTYTLTITEHNGCIDNGITTVTQPALLSDTIISVTPGQQVIHYWDFNSTLPGGGAGGDSLGTATYPLPADFTTIPLANPHITYSHPLTSGVLDNGAGPAYAYVNDLHLNGNDSGFAAAGNLWVRDRNPTKGASFIWYIPTTGYENINLDWALSASSSKGAQFCVFSYSKDGGATWNKLTAAMDTFNTGGKPHPDSLQAINPITSTSNWYPVHVSLASDPGCNNNPNLEFQVNYAGSNTVLTSGNDRWDNISVKGATIPKVSCNNSNNGSAAASVSGGTAPFTYNWSTGTTTDT